MGTYAKIENNIVVEMIQADQDFIDSGAVGDPSQWLLGSNDGSVRGRYPGIGYSYDPIIDEFIPPKPVAYPSWVWSSSDNRWIPPVAFPANAMENKELYEWNETNQSWDLKTLEEMTFELTGRLYQALQSGSPISQSEFLWK